MDRIRWWFDAKNPRPIYLGAGALFTSGFYLGLITLPVPLPVWLYVGVVMLASLAMGAAIDLIRWQRRREEYAHMMHTIQADAEFERLTREALCHIAELVNDDAEAAGHGRPVAVHRMSYH